MSEEYSVNLKRMGAFLALVSVNLITYYGIGKLGYLILCLMANKAYW